MGRNQVPSLPTVRLWVLAFLFLFLFVVGNTTAYEVVGGEHKAGSSSEVAVGGSSKGRSRNAYATLMYMGTPRDYEFYVATRVLIRSLSRLNVDADLVVIASKDVPLRWVHALEHEDGAKVVSVDNLNNPYKDQANFDRRFKLSLNKLYVWNLVEYERVVMLDADNLFLKKTDELFQCGQFCAVFINPCIFHTGLFVLQPSAEVFKDMKHQLEVGKVNPDGADQGFIGGYFPDLLNEQMFYPPVNGSSLNGHFRLPLGYQMDASYFYLKLRWNIPCGPNSVITFPGAPWLKPWYWWSWPVLPLGISWHEQRRSTLGYSAEMPFVVIQSVFYLAMIAMTRLARPNFSKMCNRRAEKATSIMQASLKVLAIWFILAAYVVPFFLIPHTIHPILGWSLYLLGSFALSSIAINAFLLPMVTVLVPWIGIAGALFVLAFPWYMDGVVRALAVFMYAFCCAPVVWAALVKMMTCLQVSIEREAFLPRLDVESITLKGDNLDQLIVTSKEIDAAVITVLLHKKLGSARLIDYAPTKATKPIKETFRRLSYRLDSQKGFSLIRLDHINNRNGHPDSRNRYRNLYN